MPRWAAGASESFRVSDTGGAPGRVVVSSHPPAGGVRDDHVVLDGGQRTVEDPEAAIDRPPVEYLDRQLDFVGVEEPEGPRFAAALRQQRPRLPRPIPGRAPASRRGLR